MWKHIRISKFPEEMSFDIAFASFGGALVVGRIVYGILHFSEFGFNIMKYILVNGYPGISSGGMIVGGVGVMYVMCQKNKIRFTEFSDYLAPSLFIFSFSALVGAFVAGIEPGSMNPYFRHPVALYKAALLGLGAYFSIRMFYDIRKEKIEKGALLFFFLGVFSFATIAFSSLRDKRVLLTESAGEWYLILTLLLTSAFYFVYYFRVLLVTDSKTFINSIHTNVKQTFKNISRKTKDSDRGGAEKTPHTD